MKNLNNLVLVSKLIDIGCLLGEFNTFWSIITQRTKEVAGFLKRIEHATLSENIKVVDE